MHRVGGYAIEKTLNYRNDHRGASIPCDCGAKARFEGYRSKQLTTMLSAMTLKRAYYHCENCGQGQVPLDRELDIEDTCFSPGARRMMARVGARGSFKNGCDDLEELAGLSLYPKAVERTAETIGWHIELAEKVERDAIMQGKVVPMERSVQTLYAAVDGTAVPVVPGETAGRKGKQPDGSSKTREVKLGCVFTQTTVDEKGRAVRDANSTTYTAAIETAEEFGPRIYAEAVRRGLNGAQKVVVLGDGAPWIWNIADEQFHGAVQIVDLYHAREHLSNLSKSLFKESEPRRKKWYEKAKSMLDEGEIERLVKKILSLKISHKQHEKTIVSEAEYFAKNKERMRYAKFRDQGLFVGSGVVEAGCKAVIGQRLKLSGMRWTVNGANAIISLRCCLLSGKWTDYWEQRACA